MKREKKLNVGQKVVGTIMTLALLTSGLFAIYGWQDMRLLKIVMICSGLIFLISWGLFYNKCFRSKKRKGRN